MLLVKGNKKLGKIYQFSIPAGSTCPGKSRLCDASCYAQRGFYAMPNVAASLKAKLKATKRVSFVQNMITEITAKRAAVVRLHCAGDFASATYTEKWLAIVKACPDTTFYAYTRSWRVASILPVLRKLAQQPNFRLWFSIDQETGMPKVKPPRVRFAYMSVNTKDIPSKRNDLVFRDYPLRGEIQKYINDIQVCPPENGVTDTTCEKCGICYRDDPKDSIVTNKRISLAIT